MKTVLEQLIDINAKLAELETAIMGVGTSEFEPCYDGHCGCGCDEPETEIENNNITVEHGVNLTRGKSITPGQAQMIAFTKAELITFAAKLMDRTIEACKEAVNNIEFDSDFICDLSLSYSNQIEVEIDNSAVQKAISDEVDNTIELDNDSVETEVDNILDDMLSNKQD